MRTVQYCLRHPFPDKLTNNVTQHTGAIIRYCSFKHVLAARFANSQTQTINVKYDTMR